MAGTDGSAKYTLAYWTFDVASGRSSMSRVWLGWLGGLTVPIRAGLVLGWLYRHTQHSLYHDDRLGLGL